MGTCCALRRYALNHAFKGPTPLHMIWQAAWARHQSLHPGDSIWVGALLR